MKTLAEIAAELQGYDPQAMTAEGVLDFLSRLVMPVREVLEVPLMQALGQVLAVDVMSPVDVPPHDNSAMDGYAFAGTQLTPGTALTLQVVGTALAGRAWQGSVQPGQCVRIMTGAVMPAGLDTVVPQEFVSLHKPDGTEVITIPQDLLQTGDNRRLRGEDLMQGRAALLKGQRITPARLGLAASLGLGTLQVWRPVRVAYFSTGDEILSLGDMPREGAVYDSNRYTVFGMLSRLGCQVIDLGVVRDDPALLQAAFTTAAAQADAIITSGGVSVGEADYTKVMMKKLGDVDFWRIAMRPGRPMAVGRLSSPQPAACADQAQDGSASGQDSAHSALLFGLPGNPVAVMVTFLAFVRPALLQMMGAAAEPDVLLKAHSTQAIRKKPGRTEYQRGRVSTAPDGRLQVETTGSQGSGVLSSMAQANGLIVLHHHQSNVAAGDEVDVLMFDGAL